MRRLLLPTLALTLLLAGCKGRTQAPEEGMDVVPEALTDSVAIQKAAQALPEEPVMDIVTSMGTIKVRLFKDTPRHRDNFVMLALSGYYDNLMFHRVIDGFMIQGGDPISRDTLRVDSWGQGGPGYTLPAEILDADGNPLHRHKKGALAAARRGNLANPFKESSGSQFYLVQNPDNCTHLDGEYTVFGETVAGLNVIDRIASAQTNKRDLPLQPIRIITIKPDDELNAMAQNSQEN